MQQTQTIQVFVRLKPPNHSSHINNNNDITNSINNNLDDSIDNSNIVVKVDESNTIVSLIREKKGQNDFQFTKVFSLYTNQKLVYESCNVINDVLEGLNCCIMAYGQTGSGILCYSN